MIADDYRVMQRPEANLKGAWGLWSDKEGRWLDTVFSTEREAKETLKHLLRHDGRKDRQ